MVRRDDVYKRVDSYLYAMHGVVTSKGEVEGTLDRVWSRQSVVSPLILLKRIAMERKHMTGVYER
jgi:hypothetical protein